MPSAKQKPKLKVKTLDERIIEAAWAGLGKRISGIPTEFNFCLKFVRRVVETAMGLRDRGFYDLVIGEDSNPSAKELEALLRQQRPNWVVVRPQAGDLVFWRALPPEWGHVGVLVQHGGVLQVAQNTTITTKGTDFGGALQLVPLSQMAKPTTVIRIGG